MSRRRVAWLLILVADAGLLLWGAMAALLPERLAGPGSQPILAAGYEGFTGGSWQAFSDASPKAAGYDQVVGAIGPFEMTEFLGIGLIYLALAITAPLLAAGRPVQSTG